MISNAAFADLLVRVREGNEDACRTFVECYTPELRRVIRIRLHEPLLRSRFDTTDICQSVLMDFFARVRLGQYQFESSQDLVRLLMTMARHKLLNHVRRARTENWVGQATTGATVGWVEQTPDRGESPSQMMMGAELLAKAHSLLSKEERVIADLRTAGKEWQEIAHITRETAEGARKRLARAIERVLATLGLRAESQ